MTRQHFFAAAGLLLISPGVRAQSLSFPSKKEVAVLLHDAAEARNLTTQGSPPFHLTAKAHYEIAGRSLEGTYELVWASHDRYREDYRGGTVADTKVVLGDKIYVLRSMPIPDFLYWRAATLLKSLYDGTPSAAPRVNKVYAAELQSQKVICVRSETNFKEDVDCFKKTASGTALVSTIEKRPRSSKLELEDFASLGHKFFPRKITEDREDGKIEVEVTELSELSDPTGKDIFIPQAAAKVYGRCAKPETKGKMPYYAAYASARQGMLLFSDSPGPQAGNVGGSDFPYPSLPRKSVLVPYFFLIGTDGKAELSAPIEVQGEFVGRAWPPSRTNPARIDVNLSDTELQQWIDSEKFPIRSCDGKPIEYEMVLTEPLRAP